MNRFVSSICFALMGISAVSSSAQADVLSAETGFSEAMKKESARLQILQGSDFQKALQVMQEAEREHFPAKIESKYFWVNSPFCTVIVGAKNDMSDAEFDSGSLEPIMMREAEATCLNRLQTTNVQCRYEGRTSLIADHAYEYTRAYRREGHNYRCAAIDLTDSDREQVLQSQKQILNAAIQRQVVFIEKMKNEFSQERSKTQNARAKFVQNYREAVALSDRFVACMRKRNGIDNALFDMENSVENRTSCVAVRNDMTAQLKKSTPVENIQTLTGLQIEARWFLASSFDLSTCRELLAKCEASDGPTAGVGQFVFDTAKSVMKYVNEKK